MSPLSTGDAWTDGFLFGGLFVLTLNLILSAVLGSARRRA